MNYYELLGVKNNASFDEIKEAYKKQMKKWHPDINKDANAVDMSTKINEAKEVLLDEEKRRDYDIYLTKKTEESYNRYTQRKSNTATTHDMEDVTITKWDYLKDWYKNSVYSKSRKILGVIGVLLESFLCFIIKIILIGFAILCNYVSYFIQVLFGYIYPIIGIIVLLFGIKVATSGFKPLMEDNPELFKAIIVLAVLFISSFILPLISKLVISPKVFDILYNKIDVSLFKKCVGYKEKKSF